MGRDWQYLPGTLARRTAQPVLGAVEVLMQGAFLLVLSFLYSSHLALLQTC